VGKLFQHDFELTEAPFGGAAIDAQGDPLPEATLQFCLEADAVLLGAVGGPKWSAPNAKARPETGLLRLRRELGVYANLRPVSVYRELADASTIKAAVLEGVDFIFVRELTTYPCVLTDGATSLDVRLDRSHEYLAWTAAQMVSQFSDEVDGDPIVPQTHIGIGENPAGDVFMSAGTVCLKPQIFLHRQMLTGGFDIGASRDDAPNILKSLH
jgi:hypothetical protein